MVQGPECSVSHDLMIEDESLACPATLSWPDNVHKYA